MCMYFCLQSEQLPYQTVVSSIHACLDLLPHKRMAASANGSDKTLGCHSNGWHAAWTTAASGTRHRSSESGGQRSLQQCTSPQSRRWGHPGVESGISLTMCASSAQVRAGCAKAEDQLTCKPKYRIIPYPALYNIVFTWC